MRTIEKIYIHCSASEFGTLELVREWHKKERGWKDIGYHYLITNGFAEKSGAYDPVQDGAVHKGRPESVIGSHVKGDNHSSLGICLIGTDTFSPKQIAALRHLLRDIVERHKIIPRADTILGHRDYWDQRGKPREKDCPGFDIAAIRKNLYISI